MNEMYEMSIVAHNYSVIGILVIIFINMLILFSVNDLLKLRKLNVIVTPTGAVLLASTVFTGIVMMAAKHLDFSIENIVMIVFSVIFIILEAKRSKALKYLNKTKPEAIGVYKSFARKILQIEVAGILAVAMWMWLG